MTAFLHQDVWVCDFRESPGVEKCGKTSHVDSNGSFNQQNRIGWMSVTHFVGVTTPGDNRVTMQEYHICPEHSDSVTDNLG